MNAPAVRPSLLGAVVTGTLRHAAEMHHARVLAGPGFHARDRPVIASGAPEATRVLVLGSGITEGWGVQTHGLGLLGGLQRAVQARMQHPCDVELVGEPGLELGGAASVLGDRATEDWDAVVVALGVSDTVRLTAPRIWMQQLGALLAKLDSDMPHGALVPVVVVGIPPMDSIARYHGPLSPVFRRHADQLNELSAAVVARNRRATFVPLPAMAQVADRPFGSPEAYAAWADVIADEVVGVLPPEVRRIGDTRSGDAHAAPEAAVLLDPANRRAAGRVQALLRTAAGESASFVAVSMLNGDRIWTVLGSGGAAPRSAPRASTFCDATLREGFLHVPDAASDPRYRDLVLAGRLGFASYMGVALERDGERIGTVALFNGAVSGAIGSRLLGGLKDAIEGELRALLDGEGAEPIGTPPTGALPVLTIDAPVADEQAEEDGRRSAPMLLRRLRFRSEGRRLTQTARSRIAPSAGGAVRLPGLRPLHVLLVGGEYAIGYGAGSRVEALDGAIARLLRTQTGRGVVVENRSQAEVRLHQLAGSLGASGASGFDLVVWAPTFSEAVHAPGPARWLGGLAAMLHRVESTSDAGVVLLGIPALLGNQPLAVLGRGRAAGINRRLQMLAGWWDRVAFVEPPPVELGTVDEADGPEVYRQVAISILPAALELLDVGDAPVREAPPAPAPGPLETEGELVGPLQEPEVLPS